MRPPSTFPLFERMILPVNDFANKILTSPEMESDGKIINGQNHGRYRSLCFAKRPRRAQACRRMKALRLLCSDLAVTASFWCSAGVARTENFPVISGHSPVHESVEQRNGKCSISMVWAPDHSLVDQLSPGGA